MTEIEYKDYIYKKAKKVKTREDLDKLLDEVIDCKELDYSQIVYAMCACMNATFNCINENNAGGGITGFQAGFIGWEMLKKYLALEDNKCGLKLVDYDNMLYPQYEKQFSKTISKDSWNSLQAEARKKLEENEACEEVLNHCKKIASGEVPFGYTVREE